MMQQKKKFRRGKMWSVDPEQEIRDIDAEIQKETGMSRVEAISMAIRLLDKYLEDNPDVKEAIAIAKGADATRRLAEMIRRRGGVKPNSKKTADDVGVSSTKKLLKHVKDHSSEESPA